MVRYTRNLNYERRLSRALVLADRRRLVTLRAAAGVINEVIRSAKPPTDTLDHAIALLLMAAKSGTPEHVAAATNEVEHILRDRRGYSDRPRRKVAGSEPVPHEGVAV